MNDTLFNNDKIILDLCGGTGSWSKPYKENGYDVRVIDPQEWLEDDYGTGDVRLFKKPTEKIYGVLSAPPCTHFSGSGARHWKKKGKEPLLEGLSVVDACLRIIFITKPKFWVLENPVGRLKHYIGDAKCTFQPYEYGDAYSKRTCLWGDFNMPKPTNIVEPDMVEFVSKKGVKKRMARIFYESFSLPPNERARLRSMTPPGFAQAFYESNK
jgi:site-specific DNA-cytosine methylase